MKRILICRHAHAEAASHKGDFYRRLDARGREAAAELGRRLALRGVLPELVYSSPASRTLETAELVLKGLDIEPGIIVKQDCIYNQDSGLMLELFMAPPPDIDCVMLFGHNPSAALFAARLQSGVSDVRMPPGALYAIDFEADSWDCCLPGNGVLAFRELP